jgi:hypothetical protein
MAPHHGTPTGTIAIIDQRLGLENPAAITNLTPSIQYSVATDTQWATGDKHYPRRPEYVVTPYPTHLHSARI